jgi:hypothetical protein
MRIAMATANDARPGVKPGGMSGHETEKGVGGRPRVEREGEKSLETRRRLKLFSKRW